MIKLLLVDDEKYTREGIIEEIDWALLGIDEVIQAKNGLEAYELALSTDIDLLVSDVKMPKMNGIDMAYKIQSLYPDCPIIFMSGYTDKEYLKSAIELNAVRYIEKPLDIDELTVAIKKSLYIIEENRRYNNIKSLTLPIIRDNLATQLCKPNQKSTELRKLVSNHYPKIQLEGYFQTILVKDSKKDGQLINHENERSFSLVLNNLPLPCIWGYKDFEHIIIHLQLDATMMTGVDIVYLEDLGATLSRALNISDSISLIGGTVVLGIEHILDSYREAVIASKQLFLHPDQQALLPSKSVRSTYVLDDQIPKDFELALKQSDYTTAGSLIKKNVENIRYHTLLSDGIIKSYFYQFIQILMKYRRLNQSDILELDELTITSDFFNLNDILSIEAYLLAIMDRISQTNHGPIYSSEAVNQIIKTIHDAYNNPDMSLQSISDTIHLSISHMCVLFKKETGMTINAYMVKYRVEKSLILLEDFELKLSYIAYEVGFNDANYFAKLFKKTIGMSPSKYREMLDNDSTH